MELPQLGRAGLKVSEICLGTMTMGNGADQPSRADGRCRPGGRSVNFFDTANSYVAGTSEAMLGVALRESGTTQSSPRSSSIHGRTAQ